MTSAQEKRVRRIAESKGYYLEKALSDMPRGFSVVAWRTE